MSPLIPDSPKRRRDFSKCSLFLFGITALLLFFIGKPLIPLLRSLRARRFYEFPPREVFFNETDITRVSNRSDVVQPLVGLNDTFDIAVTVWQPSTDEERMELYRLSREKDAEKQDIPAVLIGLDATPEQEAEAAAVHSAYLQWYGRVSTLEKAIFSDIVFRGVHLSDTDLHANVSFQIPTEIFQNHPGNNFDLRASFVVIPRSPSPIDYFKNYTSWFPKAVNRPRFKTLPFPQESPTQFYRRPVDLALDASAITIPLLERHAVPSICPRPSPVEDYYSDEDPAYADEQILEKHPHVVTRTHLRIVRESRLYRLQDYMDRHNRLRNISCGQMREDHKTHLQFCHKSYLWNGNWEVLLNLAVPDAEAEGGFRKEYAYAPYMDVLHNVAGPKDIVPVPINREWCGAFAGDAPTMNRTISDHMNITWRLSYSSVTPRKFLLGDLKLTPAQRSNYTESEYVRAMKHDLAETYASLHGYRHHPDSHPRRRFVRLTVFTLLFFLLLVLNCTYWATRPSTVSISVPGTLCIAGGDLISIAAAIWSFSVPTALGDNDPHFRLALMLGFRQLPRPLFMLWAISRARLSLQGLQWARASHQERASARLDARADWRWKFGLFAVILLAEYTLDLYARFLVAPVMPDLIPGDISDTPKHLNAVVEALKMAGGTMQLVLNYRARVFAGKYKAAVVLGVVVETLSHASAVSWLFGRSEIVPGILYWDVLRAGYLGVWCWQAWRYSSRIPEDEHGEDGD